MTEGEKKPKEREDFVTRQASELSQSLMFHQWHKGSWEHRRAYKQRSNGQRSIEFPAADLRKRKKKKSVSLGFKFLSEQNFYLLQEFLRAGRGRQIW